MMHQNHSEDPFSYKVRVRVCGILKEKEEILLLKHNTIGPAGYLWAPPGGGVEFGESLEECLKKEFLEETNLIIDIGKYLFTYEFIGERHHAIEVFFEVKRKSGELKLGNDPELPSNKQILDQVKFFSADELENLPEKTLHHAFYLAKNPDRIEELKGLLTFKHL